MCQGRRVAHPQPLSCALIILSGGGFVRISRCDTRCRYIHARAPDQRSCSLLLPSSRMAGREKRSQRGGEEEKEGEDESGSEFEVDDEEGISRDASESQDEDSDDPEFSHTRKRKRGGGGGSGSGGSGRSGSGGEKAARGKKKPATAVPGAAAPTCTSEYRGVYWKPADRRWAARFNHNGKQMYLGQFYTEEGAARAHDRMAVWCHMHGLVVKVSGGKGGWHNTSSFLKDLNFEYG